MRNTIDCLKELKKEKISDEEKAIILDELLRNELSTLSNLCHEYEKDKEIYDDRLQESLITLSNNYSLYDIESGIPFTEFYIPIIRKRLDEVLRDERILKGEIDELTYKLNKLLDAEEKLRNKLNRKPSHDEIAKELDITHEEFHELRNYALEVLGIGHDSDELIIDLVNSSSKEIDEETFEEFCKTLN